ncbi:hypothetical protein FQA39_LY15625 [Lamprigera yunnana]|nr:hypothetical protein FQA39_LY15625 [Lamprigera yunnana]
MTHFEGRLDRFNGVTVDSVKEHCELADFTRILQDSLKAWKNSSKRSVWFKVALQHAEWIPILIKNGFIFHHAKETFVMLRMWIAEEVDLTPPYAHTMVGVGAVVINDDNVLVVQEKYGISDFWKLPGGYVEPGENIIDAAIREVYEETNINTEFKSVLNVRHAHGGSWGCSDLYFVICLKPLTFNIVKCDREIKNSRWMEIKEYLEHSEVHELNKFFVQTYLNYNGDGIAIDCSHSIHPLLKKAYTVYYGKTVNNK